MALRTSLSLLTTTLFTTLGLTACGGNVAGEHGGNAGGADAGEGGTSSGGGAQDAGGSVATGGAGGRAASGGVGGRFASGGVGGRFASGGVGGRFAADGTQGDGGGFWGCRNPVEVRGPNGRPTGYSTCDGGPGHGAVQKGLRTGIP